MSSEPPAQVTTTPEDVDQTTLRKVATASFLGNFIEWFDYAAYAYLATVIARVFFPQDNPTVALLQTFAVFALSFIMRPIGAVVWGHWGDERGRRWALSMSILLMSGATFCIGLLPPHHMFAFAPILLLLFRMVQGFSASGEYAGAAIFLAEYAPAEKRGQYVSLVPASTATGLLVGSLFATVLHTVLSTPDLESWGWRIPFLLAGPLGLITRYIRVHLEDSPVYNEMMAKAQDKTGEKKVKVPLLELFSHWRVLLISFGVASLNAVGFYVVLTYLPTYLSTEIQMEENLAFLASTITLAVYIGLIFLMGTMSDRHGRKKMLILASIGFIVLTVPAFWVLGIANFWGILAIELLLCALLTINDGTLASYLAETFPTRVRYSGFAVSFNLANAIFGGTAPLISTALIGATGNKLAPAFWLVLIAIWALVCMILSKEYAGKDLRHT